MPFSFEDSGKYVDHHTDEENNSLRLLSRETHLKSAYPQMLSGHVQGNFLRMICKLIHAKNVLEIGTFTGYATICLAQGISGDGKVYTIEAEREFESLAKKYFALAGVADKIEWIFGDAKKIIPTLNATFDLVFIDANKQEYLMYYDLIFDKLKPGAVIVADNMFWHGQVFTEDKDPDTVMIKKFAEYITKDDRVEKIIVPLRDGLFLIRKK
jgi:predicted O-methyltransferase YrrM